MQELIDISQLTNHSGGASGADTMWDVIGSTYGMVKNRHYYAEGGKTPRGNVMVPQDQLKYADVYLKNANKTLRRTFPTAQPYVNNLLRRNYWQVKNSEAVFAISTITENVVDGGTGWACHMAIDLGQPVHVFDQLNEAWFSWWREDGAFVMVGIPTLTADFAGIGTRNINDAGKKAIRDVYEKYVQLTNKIC